MFLKTPMVRNQRDEGKGSYTVTNHSVDRALDCNGDDDLATADVLGSLIADLIEAGIIKGSVS